MSDNILIMTVGLPRSGKSTWAREQGHPIVNPDSIRLAIHGQPMIRSAELYIWAVAHTMVRALFLAGHTKVILDACNNTKKRRNEWIDDLWKREFVVMEESPEVCSDRILNDEQLTQKHANLLFDVIEHMVRTHEPVDEAIEGRVVLIRASGAAGGIRTLTPEGSDFKSEA